MMELITRDNTNYMILGRNKSFPNHGQYINQFGKLGYVELIFYNDVLNLRSL